jgi:hypothetical protein
MDKINTFVKIQSELKAPKDKKNNFGNYKYRNVEGILDNLKPILEKYNAILTMNDEIVLIGDRYYVKATASIYTESETYSSSAYAREAQDKKGMDDAQITGACSSYARKYALGGLLAIDSGELDADETNTHGKEDKPKQPLIEAPVAKISPKKALIKWLGDNGISVEILKRWAIDEKISLTEENCDIILKDGDKLKDLKTYASAEQAKEIK